MDAPKNLGDQISDAVNDAINKQDFSALKETVGRAIDLASENISRGLAQAHEKAKEAPSQTRGAAGGNQAYVPPFQAQAERLARRQQTLAAKQANAQLQARYVSVTGQKVAGYAMAIGGGVLAAGFGATALGLGLGGAVSAIAGLQIGAVACGVFVIPSVILLGLGIARINLANTFKRFCGIIGPRSVVNVSELAQRSRLSVPKARAALDRMLRRGWFREGRLDASEECLMVTDEAYEQYQHARALLAEQRRTQAIEAKTKAALQAAEEKRRAEAGVTAKAQEVLDRGNAYLSAIRESNAAIPGAEITAKIDQIELVVQSIFERAQEHPEVIGDLTRLMDYYLPTTVKLLDAYEDLDAQPVQTDNIRESKRQIEDTLDTLSVAFEKLLDSVFRDTAWDVSTDISVLHTVLAQEGLTENPFEKSSDTPTLTLHP
ncbi:5-bromo-4-chloroindolyl phosphate hydrolysis family protein [Xiamenia xianingshaonis]|uniref:5-bromo-4-chloroindolyl phosphate hydrolysis family protein n=2 Tax=Xiamenia xianingshaonis TaxID=2682776 RepID=A0A9E6MSJ1_9ACTN|nr:5-bromo-4-chloroindolyl phosphate hydrolysis family protein [Xiamenia xianingshaonis]QTU85114.1 5-bromo-4-chloroindolyl phosphate hydrolysis family protein [Xiamenia xianingshaonis]